MNAADYAYWREALKGNFGPVHDGDAQCGFWRVRDGKSGPWLPVAIWLDDAGDLQALRGGRPTNAPALWSWCCRYPVTEEAYRAAVDGKPWPDEDASIGHNQGPADDSLEALRDQIDSAKAGVDAYAEVNDDATAAKAQSLRSRLNELSRTADKKRDELKRPHLEAGKAIDADYMPLVKAAKAAADAIAKALSAHETRKARAAAEAQRKADEERRKREEEAAKAGAPTPEPVPEPEPAPVPPTQIRGGYGKAASVRVVKVATVVDQDKAYQAMRTHPELVELIAKLAQRAANAGHEIAGVDITEERKVA